MKNISRKPSPAVLASRPKPTAKLLKSELMRQLRYADGQHTLICNALGVSADPNSDSETASEAVNRLIAMLHGFVADFDASAEGRMWRLRSPGPGVDASQPKSVRLARTFLANLKR